MVGREFLLEQRPDLHFIRAVGEAVLVFGEHADVHPVLAGLGQHEDVFPFQRFELAGLAALGGVFEHGLGAPAVGDAVTDVEDEGMLVRCAVEIAVAAAQFEFGFALLDRRRVDRIGGAGEGGELAGIRQDNSRARRCDATLAYSLGSSG